MRAAAILLMLGALVGTVVCGEAEPEANPPAGEKPGAAAGEPLEGYEVFVHPLGFRFQRPSTWKVQETAPGLLLTPPDAAVSAQGPLESYLIAGAPCPEGIASLDDPRVRQLQTGYIQSVLPFLRPVDDGKSIRAASAPGVRHTWRGSSPDGREILGRVYTVLEDGHLFGLMAVGEKARVAAREKTLETIFSTCAVVKPTVDERMCGIWTCEVDHASGLPGQQTHVATTITYVLLPGGTIHSTSRTAIFGAWRRSPGVTDTWDRLEAIVKDFPDHGRWGAGGGNLYMLWRDGTAAGFRLHIQGAAGQQEALLTAPDGSKRLWTQRR